MIKPVLLRHGESTWNRENRFTGWTDVDLSERGIAEAQKAGQIWKKQMKDIPEMTFDTRTWMQRTFR